METFPSKDFWLKWFDGWPFLKIVVKSVNIHILWQLRRIKALKFDKKLKCFNVIAFNVSFETAVPC
jgi:hypothetical protein